MRTTLPDFAALGIEANFPLADASPAAILIIQDGLIVYGNAAASEITGYPPEELLGMKVVDLATPESRAVIEERQSLRKRGEVVPKHVEMNFLTRDRQERWIDCTFNFLTLQGKPTTIANGIDITARKQAEQEKEKLLITERQARLQAIVMRDANLAITQDLNLERVLETLLEHLRKLVPYDSANVMLLEDSNFVVRAIQGYENFIDDLSLARALSFDAKSSPIFAEICSSHRSVLVPDTEQEAAWERTPGGEHARNWIGVPLIAYGKTIGLYSLDKAQPGFFTPEHMRLAESLAAPAASAIANARLFQRGRENAGELEQRIVERERVEMALRESEERFRQLSEAAFEAIILHDQGTILEVNQSFCRMYRYERAEVIGKSVLDLALPQFREQLRQIVRSGDTVPYESPGLRKDGTVFSAEVAGKPINYQGRVVRVAAVRDITEQKRNERRQAAQYAITRVLAESATLADAIPKLLRVICESLRWKMGEFWRVCDNTNLLRCMETWHVPTLEATSFIEVSRQTEFAQGVGLPGRVWQSRQPAWVPDLLTDPHSARAAIAAKVGLSGALAFPILLADQTLGVMVFFSRRTPEVDEDLLKLMSAIGSQIGQFTERRRVEGALRQAEEKYRTIFENAVEGIFRTTADGRFITANPAMARMLGFSSPEELICEQSEGAKQNRLDPERREEFTRLLAEHGFVRGFEYEGRRRDGSKIWLSESVRAVRDESGTPLYYEGIAEDITERKQAEEALRQAEQKYRDIFENAFEGIFQSTPNGRFITANPALARMLGYDSPDELLSSRTDIARQHYVEPAQRDEFKRQLEEFGVVRDFEHLAYRKDGRKIWLSENVRSVCDENGAVLYYEGFTEDITAGKHAEHEKEKLLIAERQARLQAVVMRDANLAITQDLNLERVLETLLEYLRKLVPYDSANVMLLEDSKFVVRAISGYENFTGDLNVVRALRFDAKSNAIFAELCSSHRSVLVPDTEQESAWERVPGADHARNWIGVPLIAYGKTIGLYSLDKAEPGFFTPEHMRLAESLAAPAASAIANARLFRLASENAGELEQRIVECGRIETALRESESFRRTIIESEPECLKLVGPDYALIDMNSAGLAMIGADSKEQVIGQSVLSLVATEWRYSYMAMHESVLRGESVIFEFEMIGLNGKRRRMETHAAPLRDSASDVIAQLAITRDITDRKNAEESLSIFRNLIDRSTDAIEVLDPSTLRFLDCNKAAHQTLGYTREEFLSLSAFDIDPLLNPASAAPLIEEVVQSGRTIFESVHRRKDGSTFPVEINVKNIRLEKDYRLAVVRDISERKQAQERLQEYEKVVEGLEEMIAVVDREYRYLLANQSFLDYRNITREQVIGRPVAELAGKDLFEQTIRKHLDECFQGKVVRYEMTYVFPTRGERQLSVSYFPIDGPHGIDRAACVLNDITDQKRAQESLMQSEGQLAEAQRLASVGNWNWDLRTGAVTWSDELYRIYGIPHQEIQFGKTSIELIHPDDRDLVMNSVEAALRTKEAYSFYYRIRRSDGVERILHSRGLVVCDEHGEPIRMSGAAQDVTEHRQAEEALRQAEKKYREIFENAGEGIFQSTPDGHFIAANPALARICGFDSSEELIRLRTDIAADIYFEPELREEFKRRLEECGVVREFEHQLLRKDGSKTWIMVNARVVRDEQGEVLYYEGTVQDINERKLAEARSAAFATLALRLSGVMTQLDAAKIIAETADELFGWDSCNLDLYDEKSDLVQPLLNVDTIAGRRVDVTASISASGPTARTRHIIDHGPELNLRKEPIKFEGDSIPFGDKSRPSASLMGVPICQTRTVIGLLSIQSYSQEAYDDSDLRDLQALATYCGEALNRVRIEESLRESEERYRELFESAKDAYYVHDLQGRYLSVNRAAENLAGRPREEIIGRRFSDFIAPEQLPAVSEKLCRKLIEEGETSYETEVVASDGRRVPVEVTSHLIYDNGVAVRVQGTARNITERKRAEAALRQSEREYRGLFENARDAILIIDPAQEIVLAVNQRACEVYGISRSEFVGISLQTISSNAERGQLVIKETLEQGMAHDFETIQRRGDGTEMFLHINASVVEYKGQIAIQSINRDITEQKRAEEALQSYPRQLIEAQEAERQSVARELHDQIGQVLTAIHLNLQAVRKTCETSEACVLIDEGVAIVDEALGQVRNLSFELRPSLLDDLGLAAALRWYTDRFTQRTGIQATTAINLPGLPARLTKDLETACFRITQEALTNVVRHAQARNVAVRVQKLNGEVRLTVKDDGVGFDVRSQNLSPFSAHLGLRGMRERALALDGSLDIRSSGRGTRISVSFPDGDKKQDRHNTHEIELSHSG